MRGIGGPLLCIGDLLGDVGDEGGGDSLRREASPSSLSILNNAPPDPLPDLTNLFQENYEHLNSALAGSDHSWTSLTLKLCTALETANELVQSTNSNVSSLLEKVEELQKIVKRGDSAIAAAKTVYVTPDNHIGALK
ncbi:uncharacterized protein LOC133288256 [Gastrolobium bilobum]|uniref:uncharacterized protein LOC133288256 n=1 Tax=Gastrolobium bilobum TaxID=150636 RepID=UPI002AB0D44C|nr:uncharacterized protein LOC133288256 [Gastrolobium bilobum]XP_061341960.1 uncharacterized protein LOC133288256 [Gastrolobium bilobum]XP_061341961.1 uncharacterized protein LOC133288256 [Gastrolobium bilobum]